MKPSEKILRYLLDPAREETDIGSNRIDNYIEYFVDDRFVALQRDKLGNVFVRIEGAYVDDYYVGRGLTLSKKLWNKIKSMETKINQEKLQKIADSIPYNNG